MVPDSNQLVIVAILGGSVNMSLDTAWAIFSGRRDYIQGEDLIPAVGGSAVSVHIFVSGDCTVAQIASTASE